MGARRVPDFSIVYLLKQPLGPLTVTARDVLRANALSMVASGITRATIKKPHTLFLRGASACSWMDQDAMRSCSVSETRAVPRSWR